MYLVGGPVRDMAHWECPPRDLDFVVEGVRAPSKWPRLAGGGASGGRLIVRHQQIRHGSTGVAEGSGPRGLRHRTGERRTPVPGSLFPRCRTGATIRRRPGPPGLFHQRHGSAPGRTTPRFADGPLLADRQDLRQRIWLRVHAFPSSFVDDPTRLSSARSGTSNAWVSAWRSETGTRRLLDDCRGRERSL